jgi:hypothetical protein
MRAPVIGFASYHGRASDTVIIFGVFSRCRRQAPNATKSTDRQNGQRDVRLDKFDHRVDGLGEALAESGIA